MNSLLLAAILLFPTVEARNLNGEGIVLPNEFKAQVTIVMMAFKKDQKPGVESWRESLKSLKASEPDVDVYEAPLFPSSIKLLRNMIEDGMRKTTTDSTERAKVVTIMTKTEPFLNSLGVADDEEMELYLLDRNHFIRLRISGSFDQTKLATLRQAIDELQLAQSNP